jgi:hypothetical protein
VAIEVTETVKIEPGKVTILLSELPVADWVVNGHMPTRLMERCPKSNDADLTGAPDRGFFPK